MMAPYDPVHVHADERSQLRDIARRDGAPGELQESDRSDIRLQRKPVALFFYFLIEISFLIEKGVFWWL
ncbi:MAG: hypothetical protein PHP28_09745 [Actinomycetota bacterium]|nr:hypothetical protein [Actinomycetota bacterium]